MYRCIINTFASDHFEWNFNIFNDLIVNSKIKITYNGDHDTLTHTAGELEGILPVTHSRLRDTNFFHELDRLFLRDPLGKGIHDLRCLLLKVIDDLNAALIRVKAVCAGNIGLKLVHYAAENSNDRLDLLLRFHNGLGNDLPVNLLALGQQRLSLCGLPPFSGFAGEFLIYCAAFAGLFSDSVCLIVLSTVILIILALTGGLAAAAFAKAIGAVFCGEPRSEKAANAHDVPLFMNIPILVLFLLSCVLLFILPEAIEKIIPQIMPGCEDEAVILAGRMAAVSMISFTATVLAVLTLVFRTLIVKRNGERISPTWDCGFSKPTAKMEYTGTSFSANLADFFAALLHPERKIEHPQGIFPAKAELQDETEDGGIRFFWRYIFTGFNRLADKIHALHVPQHQARRNNRRSI